MSKQDVCFQSAVPRSTLLISCCVNFVRVRPKIQKSLQKSLTLRISEKTLHEQTLLSLSRLEGKNRLVVPHCTIFYARAQGIDIEDRFKVRASTPHAAFRGSTNETDSIGHPGPSCLYARHNQVQSHSIAFFRVDSPPPFHQRYLLMIAFSTLLRIHKTSILPQLRTRTLVPIYRAYATMTTDPKKYCLNRKYAPIKTLRNVLLII